MSASTSCRRESAKNGSNVLWIFRLLHFDSTNLCKLLDRSEVFLLHPSRNLGVLTLSPG
jgi:hypothetical protein